MKKYEITDETIDFCGITLHRIKALIDFGGVRKGEIGGFIEKESNLSQDGDAWVCGDALVYGAAKVYGDALVYGAAKVYGDAWVCGAAKVYGDAWVYGNAWVYGDAEVYGAAKVYGDAEVYGNAWVYGNAEVCGDAEIKSSRDYIVFKNWWTSGRYFTWTRSNDKWSVGCFYVTGEELIAKAYQDSKISGKEYERIVKYVEEIKKVKL